MFLLKESENRAKNNVPHCGQAGIPTPMRLFALALLSSCPDAGNFTRQLIDFNNGKLNSRVVLVNEFFCRYLDALPVIHNCLTTLQTIKNNL